MLNVQEQITLIEKLNRFSAGYAHIKDIHSLASAVEIILEELLNVEYSGLYLFDYNENKLKLFIAKGFTEEERKEAESTAMERHPGYVFREKKVLHIPDAANDKSSVNHNSKRSFEVRSRLYIPVLNGEESVGAFGIVSSQKNKFKEEDIALLSFVASIAGAIYGNIHNLEEIKKAQEQILSLSNLPKENPYPVFRINNDKKIIYANPASRDVLAYYGCKLNEQACGKILEYIEEIEEGELRTVGELEDGKGHIYQSIFHLIASEDYINVYATDITQRKTVEQQLMRTSLIAEETDNAVIITNIKGKIEWVNKGFLTISGYTFEEVMGKIPGDLLQGPETDPETVKEIAIALSKFEKIERDILNYSKAGEPTWIRLQIQPVFDEAGNPSNFISLQKDISKEKQIEESLKASEAKTRMIVNSALDAVILIDRHGMITDWNPQAETIFGWKKDEVLGKLLGDVIVPPELREAHKSGMKRYLDTGVGRVLNQRIEISGIRRDGTPFPVELTVSPIELDNQISFSGFIRDITKEKQAQKELESISTRLAVLIKELHAGILVEDENQKISLVNNEFLKMFSIEKTSEELLGVDSNLLKEEKSKLFDDPASLHQKDINLSENKELLLDDEVSLKDGRVLERDYIPIFANNKFFGNLWQYRDITNRKQYEQDLRNARQEAEFANIAKSRFLANMSHEIRTPMNAIYGLIRLVEGTKLSRGQKDMIDKLRISSDNLLKIINEILDFSKIESGQIHLEKSPFPIKDLIKRILESMEYLLADKRLEMDYYFDENIDPVLEGDSLRLYQVLSNLVNNAIKFTEKGKINISCKLLKKTNQFNRIQFEISDTGIGISKENVSKIFRTFEQEDESTTRRYGGTGLGLAISSQLVDLMGGKIGVISEKGKGSTFYFSLDLNVSDMEVESEKHEKPTIDPNVLAGKSLLLVEDNKYNQFIAETMLKMWSAEVVCADHGQEAIDILKKRPFDLILMDIQMPVLDGFEATTIIREKLKLDIPIIALTANVVKEIIEHCQKVGMNDYLAKPFEPEALYKRILKQLGMNVQYRSDAHLHPLLGQPEEIQSRLYELSKLEKILGGNQDQLKKMIRKFLDITPDYLIELNESMNAKDMEGVERAAHKIKASIDLIASNNVKSNIRLIHDYSKSRTNPDKLPNLVEHFSRSYNELINQLKAIE